MEQGIGTIGWALDAIRRGEKVARAKWEGTGMFIYYVGANSYPVSGNPGSPVKGMYENDMVPYKEYIAFRAIDGEIIPWVGLTGELFATDWKIA